MPRKSRADHDTGRRIVPPPDAFGPQSPAEPFGNDSTGVRAMLAAIVESSDDAIVGKDLSGTIMSWNAGAERIFGYTAEEAIGRPVLMLLPPERHAEEARILAALVRGQRIDHFETERVTKDGRRIHVSLSVSPIKDGTGRIVGGAKIARDISARKRFETEREELLAREQTARTLAEAANRAKDNFLAMISHELRTPLSPILAWSRMLRRGGLDEQKVRRGLETIERNAQAQVQLIDDLLDISRIVAGKLRLEVRPLDLGEVIENAIEVVRPAANAKDIRLHSVLDTETGMIAGDAARMQQVVWNLLSNAVKFTPKGGHVQITLERVNSHVEIAVTDNGIGIPRDFLPHLFERFQQAQVGPTRSHGGLGLGLAIVRHIVELHGGTVLAESSGEGGGATFTVKLPLVIFARTAGELERRHPTLGTSTVHAPYASLDGIRVLVVDDEPDSNEVVCAVLASCGAETRVATSAETGVQVLRQWTPDVIISDIGMPAEDGYSFIAKVRALPDRAADVPAVALTAYATTEDRVRIFSAGFQAHVLKPLDPAELVAVVASAVHRVRRT